MSKTDEISMDILQEALIILEVARGEGIPLRLLGGLAIHLQCPSVQRDSRLQRTYQDLDFVTASSMSAKTKALFLKRGYVENKTFNTLHGYQRLLFYDEERGRKVDIFLDRMQMCHTLDFRARLSLTSRTLPVTDLLLTKLQIVEINEKDILDAIALFIDHPPDAINQVSALDSAYIAGLAAQDWGLYKTCRLNLEKIQFFARERTFPDHVPACIQQVLAAIETAPKTLKWKTRALIGERVRWYELPEEHR